MQRVAVGGYIRQVTLALDLRGKKADMGGWKTFYSALFYFLSFEPWKIKFWICELIEIF